MWLLDCGNMGKGRGLARRSSSAIFDWLLVGETCGREDPTRAREAQQLAGPVRAALLAQEPIRRAAPGAAVHTDHDAVLGRRRGEVRRGDEPARRKAAAHADF